MTPINKQDATSNIAADVVFTLLSCGIYGLFWQARLFRVVNAQLDAEKHKFWPWFLLSIITCGLYNIYNAYVLAQDLVNHQPEAGHASDSLPVINLILSAFGLGIVASALLQHEINSWHA